jgi:hypothetical protein
MDIEVWSEFDKYIHAAHKMRGQRVAKLQARIASNASVDDLQTALASDKLDRKQAKLVLRGLGANLNDIYSV